MATTDTLHKGKDCACDIDQPKDVGFEHLARRVDEHIDATKSIAGFSNRALHLFVSNDVEFDDERLRRVAFDQIAHKLGLACRDNRSLASSQYRLRECSANTFR